MALLNPCIKFKKFFGQNRSFEALGKWQYENFFVTCPRVCEIQDFFRRFCDSQGSPAKAKFWKMKIYDYNYNWYLGVHMGLKKNPIFT